MDWSSRTVPVLRSGPVLQEAQVTVGEVTPLEQPADGPFTTRQLLRLDEALRIADQATALSFSIYLGDLDEPVRPAAEELYRRTRDQQRSVLIAVSPGASLVALAAEVRQPRSCPSEMTVLVRS